MKYWIVEGYKHGNGDDKHFMRGFKTNDNITMEVADRELKKKCGRNSLGDIVVRQASEQEYYSLFTD